ncbi:fused MFS/spermidine synthase [Aeoliella sp.]|uniref:fused MFS/spermidine synthase n=1 Tax=Aeoliella sp. TaxID=2795800 RepID=UPI003CCB9EEC
MEIQVDTSEPANSSNQLLMHPHRALHAILGLKSSQSIASGPAANSLSGDPQCPLGAPKSRYTLFAGAAFFVSGAASMVYEVSWSRQIGLLFGHTVQATAVVLAAYFAGMAVGYLLGGKWAARVSPLIGYGLAELVVAGWAVLIPSILWRFETQAFVILLSSASAGWQTASRVIFAFLLLLPATTALGATLPMMAELLANQSQSSETNTLRFSRISMAYALNTAGAFVGTLLASSFLLCAIGVRTSSYLAAAMSGGCATLVFLWALSTTAVHHVTSTPCDKKNDNGSNLDESRSRCWMSLAAISGFVAITLEVLYMRVFSLVFHNSTYTFGAVIAVCLASIASGAALTARLQRSFHATTLVGWVACLGAITTLSSVLIFIRLTNLDYYSYGDSFFQYMSSAFTLVAIVVSPPLTLVGMILPLAWASTGHGNEAGQSVGQITAVNAIAASSGAMVASFLLLPCIGLWQSFVVCALLLLITGLLFLVANGQLASACCFAPIVTALAILMLYCPIDSAYNRHQLGETIYRRWNSPYGWIDVVKQPNSSYAVRQNLHYRFGRTGDFIREHRQAHIPLLLHERPEDVLFTGLGTGLTAGGAISHREVERIVVVELIPEVVEAAQLLADYNQRVVDHPRVSVRIDDARHYLLASGRRFDVIVSDLFVPWESETGYLYTVEHYRAVRQRLKPRGIFCQWIPLYQVGWRDFELIADSFASIFPVTTVWWGEMNTARPIVALIGCENALELDATRITQRLATLRHTIGSADSILQSVERLFIYYQGDWESCQASLVNSDEHPRVEFLAPVSNGDQNMLTGVTLLEYFDRVLCDLQCDSVQMNCSTESKSASAQQRSAWRRLILFGGEASGREVK